MELIIDRFEGDFAVCENENNKMINIAKSSLPLDVSEGDVLIKTDNSITVDRELTKQRRQRLLEMFENLRL